jgi:hypothetical protein
VQEERDLVSRDGERHHGRALYGIQGFGPPFFRDDLLGDLAVACATADDRPVRTAQVNG